MDELFWFYLLLAAPFLLIPFSILLVRLLVRIKFIASFKHYLLQHSRSPAAASSQPSNLLLVRTLTSEKPSLRVWQTEASHYKSWLYRLSPQAIRENFFTSKYGRWWMAFQVLISIGALVNFVVLTYYTSVQFVGAGDSSVVIISLEAVRPLVKVDVVYSTLFLVDYVLFFYSAEDRLKFFFRIHSLGDLLSILPAFLVLLLPEPVPQKHVVIFYFLRLARAMNIFRTYRILSFAHSEGRRQLFTLLLAIVNIVFLGASAINVLETVHEGERKKPSLLNWHDSFYYVLVTFSTIGFGDLVPTTTESRMTVMLMIMLVIFLIPYQSAKIAKIYSMRSPYQTARYTKRRSHVIIGGLVNYTNIVDFCREYFVVNKDGFVVILSTEEPELNVRKLIRHPFYAERISYLAGSPLSSADLNRARVGEASALFLLNAPEPTETEISSDEELKQARGTDAEIVMMVLAVKATYPGLPVFAQVQDFRTKELAMDCGCDRVLCLEELKMAIFARSAVYPGITTFIANLVHTFSDLNEPLEDVWLNEYIFGSSHQVYSFEFPETVLGTSFMELVPTWYDIYGITVFAVSSWENCRSEFRPPKIFCPDNTYKIRSRDIGFAIALDGDIVELVRHYIPEPVSESDTVTEKSNDAVSIVLGATLTPDETRRVQFAGVAPASQTSLSQNDFQPFSSTTTLIAKPSASEVSLHSGDTEGNGDHAIVPAKIKFTLALEMLEGISDHFILCGSMNPRGIRHFVESLRNIQDDSPPVVLLMERAPDVESVIWCEVFAFPKVAVVEGIPLRRECLVRAGVERCRNLIVFPSGQSNIKIKDSALMDSNSVFVCKMVQAEWPHVDILVELLNGTNVGYISPKDVNWHSDIQRTRRIIGDYALNPHQRLDMYNARYLKSSTVLPDHGPKIFSRTSGISSYPLYHFERSLASGQVYVASFMDSLLCQSFFRPYILAASNLLAKNTIQLPIPPEFVNRRYGDLVKHLCAYNTIPLGLYRRGIPEMVSSDFSSSTRRVPQSRRSGRKPRTGLGAQVPPIDRRKSAFVVNSALPYVYTNCRAGDRLCEGDAVFLLVPRAT